MSERGEWPTTPARTGEAVRARILLVVDSLDVGGAERHVVDLALALRHRYDVTVACSAGGVFAGELERAALPFVLLGQTPIKRRLSLSYARWLRRIVRQGDFDLVHAHCYASSCAAAGATVDTSVPLVLTEHTEGRWKGRAARLTSRRLFCQARLTIAVSASIRRALIDDYSVPPDRVRLIINAVPSVSQPVSELISLPEDWTARPVVGVVARLQPEKGVGIFLEAVARIAVERPDARYVVVGDGPLRMALKDQTSRLGLASRVSLLDFQRNARAILPAFDLLVVPSLTEGAPLIVLEAMAAGVPIIATAAGGIPEQICHEREGLLVPPGDSGTLAAVILDLLRDPERAHCLAQAARRRATSHDLYARMLQQLQAVYAQALGRDTVPESVDCAAVDDVAGYPPGDPLLPTRRPPEASPPPR